VGVISECSGGGGGGRCDVGSRVAVRELGCVSDGCGCVGVAYENMVGSGDEVVD